MNTKKFKCTTCSAHFSFHLCTGYLYAYLPACLPPCLPACLSFFLSVFLSVCLPVYLTACLPLFLPVFLSVNPFSSPCPGPGLPDSQTLAMETIGNIGHLRTSHHSTGEGGVYT